jgi:hypothetical protein
MIDMPAPFARTSGFGSASGLDLETSITGRVLRYSNSPPVVVNVRVEALDVEDFERRTGYVSQAVSRAIARNRGQLGDDLAWAAGAY